MQLGQQQQQQQRIPSGEGVSARIHSILRDVRSVGLDMAYLFFSNIPMLQPRLN